MTPWEALSSNLEEEEEFVTLLAECDEAMRSGACTCQDDDICPTHCKLVDFLEAHP